MTAVLNVEKAYEALAMDVYAFPNGRPWDKAVGEYRLFQGMVSSRWKLVRNGVDDRSWGGGDDGWNDLACKAARYLRDDLVNTTGQRIWGLTFTLYPDGKFNIDYDYNKPEGYEESDDVITGAEINASLAELTGRKKPAP